MFSKAGVTLQENVLIKSVVLEIEVVVVTEVNAELKIYLGFSF